MMPKIYIDTSVVGGMFDVEFRFFTEIFFGRVHRNEIRLIMSALLEGELAAAPDQRLEFFQSLPGGQLEYVQGTTESDKLAELYITERVVGRASLADCQHIAIATISNADVLVSWNFKHIVNLNRIRGYNSVNLKGGLRTLEIRSPKELIEL
jgi:hypothetical protein